ncbi:MAG: transporter [Alphaproteobacteria bacterium]|nr:transporter [Alphaproteobacteria bacterium]
MTFHNAAIFIAMTCALSFAAQADAANTFVWQAATGLDYSVGKYGGPSDTSVLSIPLSLAMQSGRLRLQATLPYLNVRGPGVFAGGVVISGNNSITTRSGLGDLNLGAAWRLNRDSTEFPAIEIAGDVKVPTAGSNLGTGKYDYTAQANVYHSLSPKVMLFGSVGYQWLTSFRGYRLENGMLAAAGVNFRPAVDTSIGVSAGYHEEYYHNLGAQFSLSPYVLWDFASNWRLSTYGTVGLTKSSPDLGAGLRVIFRG